MDALFVIPALVSPLIDQKLVPALAKSVERNTILDNHSAIKIAIYKKYSNKTVTKEQEESFNRTTKQLGEAGGNTYNKTQYAPITQKLTPGINIAPISIGGGGGQRASSSELDINKMGAVTT